MWDKLIQEFSGRGMGVVLGMILGTAVTAFVAWRKRRLERRSVLEGDARDTVVLHHHLVDSVGEGPNRRAASLRIRCVGQAEVNRVVPNGHLSAVLIGRANAVSPTDTLISMEGAHGSYLLETLTNFVCDRTSNAPFDHDLYVMAPACEPAYLSQHQPIAVILIRKSDLELFEHWSHCRDVMVEHGSDGARVLTLMEMAKRFRKEQDEIARRRAEGVRTQHVETMYVLDLALDRRRADLPQKRIPWGRYESVLKTLGLE